MDKVASSVAIVIPAYNEEHGIGATLDDLLAHPRTRQAEIIVVDDGSSDRTPDIVKRYPVTLIRHSANRGYGASLKSGIRHTKAEKVITMDSDGQHTAVDVDAVWGRTADAPLVIGERSAESYQVQNRKFGKWIIRVVGEYLVEQKLPDFNSGLRGFDRRLIRSMLHMMPNGFSFSTTSTLAFLKGGYNVVTVPITTRARVGRASSVRPIKDGIKTLMLLTRIIMLFSPLRIFLPAGVLVGLWGLSVAGMDIWRTDRVSAGAVTVMVMSMFLFFFGLLADQVAMLNLRERDDGPA